MINKGPRVALDVFTVVSEFGLSVAVTIDEDDERTLIAAAQADPARFEDLYARYVHRVYGFVSRRVGKLAVSQSK